MTAHRVADSDNIVQIEQAYELSEVGPDLKKTIRRSLVAVTVPAMIDRQNEVATQVLYNLVPAPAVKPGRVRQEHRGIASVTPLNPRDFGAINNRSSLCGAYAHRRTLSHILGVVQKQFRCPRRVTSGPESQ